MSDSRLVLASTSPRRSGLLEMLGFDFELRAPDVDERPLRNEPPRRYVRRLALAKARSISQQVPDAYVLGADTTVVIDGRILGKPRTARHASTMLGKLSGRWHDVISALALVRDREKLELVGVSTTRVRFRDLDRREIRWYVATGEPSDKAGAYAVQGCGGLFVERIEGSPSNVMGFPLETFYALLRQTELSLPETGP